MPSATIESPLGPLLLTEKDGALVALTIRASNGNAPDTPLLREAKRQLDEYFTGLRRTFEIPTRPDGNAFQLQLWCLLEAIPYGETRTYGDLAKAVDTMPQAVGGGCGSNPIPIIIPCHRVVASNSLGGYSGAGGARTKQRLLALEQTATFALTP